MKSILDPDFKYVPANQTDVRVTFERIRREIEAAKKVVPIDPKRRNANA